MEKQGFGSEYDLNPSIIKADPERFADAIKKLYPDNHETIDELERRARAENPVDENSDKHSKAKVLGKFVIDFAKDVLVAVIFNRISGM